MKIGISSSNRPIKASKIVINVIMSAVANTLLAFSEINFRKSLMVSIPITDEATSIAQAAPIAPNLGTSTRSKVTNIMQ